MIHLETDLEKAVYEAISNVRDPEIGIPITELGLIYEIQVANTQANIKMTYTSMACPSGPQMKKEVEENALKVEGIESVNVEVVWSPKWNPREMASDMAKDFLGIF